MARKHWFYVCITTSQEKQAVSNSRKLDFMHPHVAVYTMTGTGGRLLVVNN